MKPSEVRTVGNEALAALRGGEVTAAFHRVEPILRQRVPFTTLDRLGALLATGPARAVDALLDRIAADGAIGGWPVIGAALAPRLPERRRAVLARMRGYVLIGDTWYATDILGERVSGVSLVQDIDATLALVRGWRSDENRWVRRNLGVAVHLWAKRVEPDRAGAAQARQILAFLQPLLGERELDVVKGIGWGLKTIGRHFPELLTAWLIAELPQMSKVHATMLRKAQTYLPPKLRVDVARALPAR